MNSVIWKFVLEFKYRQAVDMPQGAEILAVQMQHEAICIWAALDPMAPAGPREIYIIGTGHALTGAMNYLGTVQQQQYVWHIFEGER